jgi:hypothetical protein
MNRKVVRQSSNVRYALLLVLLLLGGRTAAAQTRPGSISGTVTDESSANLPGVTVTLTSPALQTPEVTKVTDAEGKYQFPELPLGTYRLVFELGGFGRFIREGIQISTGFSARVDATLKVAALEETVTVSGQSPLVDLTSTRGGATLSQDVLSSLPVSNNYQDVMNLMPGIVNVTPSTSGQILGSSGFRAYGVDRGQNTDTTMIEGIEMRTAAYPNFATVEEVEARTYGNTAEITRPGPAVQLVIKSGGNEFHGTYQEQYMTDKVQATNIDANLRAQGLQAGDSLKSFQDLAGDLGGRIIRNTLWFYGALRQQSNDRNLLGFVAGPGKDGIFGTTDDVATSSPSSLLDPTVKLSYQVTPKHKLVGFASRERRHMNYFNAGRFVPQDSTLDQVYPLFSNKAELQSVFSDRLLSTVMFATSGSQVFYHNYSTEPSALDLTTQFQTGESFHAFDNTDRYSKRSQLNGSMTYLPQRTLLGTHQFKVGGALWLNISKVNTWDRPGGDFQLVFDKGVPTQFKTLNNPIPEVKLRRDSGSAYITDSWRITNRLTANVGLRMDRFELWVDPENKPAGQFSNAVSYPRIDAGTWWAFGPRLATAYDVTGNGRTVIKGTFGGYSDDFTEFFLQNFSPLALTTTTYRWHDLNGDKLYQPGEVNLAPNGPDFLSVTGGTTATSVFSVPYSYEATASLERQIGSSTAMRLLYVYTLTTQDIQLVNGKRPYSAYNVPITRQDPGPDGVLGTSDDGSSLTLYDFSPAFSGAQFVDNEYANRDSAHNDHANSFEISATKRATSWLSGETTFLVTKHHRWLVGIPQSPNDNVFPLDDTWEESYRAAGSVKMPRAVDFSAVVNVISGVPGQRTYTFRSVPQSGTLTQRLDPFGTERGPLRTSLDLRVSKAFNLGKGRRFSAAADVFNALNGNAAWASTYVSGPTYGYATTIASPRVARFGLTFSF